MSVTSWSVSEIESAGSALTGAGTTIAGIPAAKAPHAEAFGKLLVVPAGHTFPKATDGIDSFVHAAGEATVNSGAAASATAQFYQAIEDWAESIGMQIDGTAGQVPAPPSMDSVTNTPQTSWAQAAAVLGEGAGAGGDSFSLDMAPLDATLDWLDLPFNIDELLAAGVDWFANKIISYFKPFEEALTELTGDSGAITAAGSSMQQIGTQLGDGAAEVGAVAGQVPTWQGEAGDSFRQYNTTQTECITAGASVAALFPPSMEGVAGNTAAGREMVIKIVQNIIQEVINHVAPNLFWFACAFGLSTLPSWFGDAGRKWLERLVNDFFAWLSDIVGTEVQQTVEVLRRVQAQGAAYLGQLSQLGTTMERAAQILLTGEDPGDGFGVEPGSMADSMTGTDRDERDGLLIDVLAEDPPDGMTNISDDPDALAELGLTPDMLRDDENGFGAKVYIDEDGNYVVKFDGTEFMDLNQTDMLKENVPGGTGIGPQSEMAMAIAEAIGQSDSHGDVVYAGHSLGGRLAAIAAMTSGNPAVTANAAGVSPATIDYIAQQNGMTSEELMHQVDNGLVRAYVTDDDLLTNLQENTPVIEGLMPDAPGARHDLDGDASNPISGHLKDNVQEAYDREYSDDRPDTLSPSGAN